MNTRSICRLRIAAALAVALPSAFLPSLALAAEPSAESIVDALNGIFGKHKARAAHAKGQCVIGDLCAGANGRGFDAFGELYPAGARSRTVFDGGWQSKDT